MFTDVAELREFYTSPLGQVARKLLQRQFRQLWPNLKGQSVLALGYATPLLRPLLDEAERVLAFMPMQQGVIAWPKEGTNRTALVDECALPLQDFSVDRVLLVHTVESAPHLDAMMNEVWRVLAGGGRLLVIAPNRTGLWAKSDATPFGNGAAFSSRQIKTLLKNHLFIPEQEGRALFIPPSQRAFWHKTAPAWERIGQRWLGALAGVHFVEASKQLYAPTGKRVSSKAYVMPTNRPVWAGLRRS